MAGTPSSRALHQVRGPCGRSRCGPGPHHRLSARPPGPAPILAIPRSRMPERGFDEGASRRASHSIGECGWLEGGPSPNQASACHPWVHLEEPDPLRVRNGRIVGAGLDGNRGALPPDQAPRVVWMEISRRPALARRGRSCSNLHPTGHVRLDSDNPTAKHNPATRRIRVPSRDNLTRAKPTKGGLGNSETLRRRLREESPNGLDLAEISPRRTLHYHCISRSPTHVLAFISA